LVVGACAAHPHEQAGILAEALLDQGASAQWSTALPETHANWRAFADATSNTLVAVGDGPRDPRSPSRVVIAVDPDTGALRWQWDSSPGQSAGTGQVFVTEERVTLVFGAKIVSLDAATGQVAWSFDPAGRPVDGALHAEDGRLVVSLGGTLLVVIDALGGEWIKAIEVFPSRLVALTEENLAIIGVVPSPGGESQPALVAVDLAAVGGESPVPPFAQAVIRWRTPVTGGRTPIQVVDDKLVGELANNQLWAIAADTGKVMYREPLRLTARTSGNSRRVRGWTTRRRRVSGVAPVTSEELNEKPKVAVGQTLFSAADSLILTQGEHRGVATQLVRIDAHAGADLALKWSYSALGSQPFLVARVLEGRDAALLVRRTEAVLVDLKVGRELRSWRLDGPRPWTDVAFARGLVVVYQDDKISTIESHAF
jgi:outer membrane protein assembly factor BamB